MEVLQPFIGLQRKVCYPRSVRQLVALNYLMLLPP